MDFLITSCLLVCGSFVVVYFVLFEIYHLKLVDYVFHRKCKNCLYFYVFWILQYRLLQFLLNKSYAIVFCLCIQDFLKYLVLLRYSNFGNFLVLYLNYQGTCKYFLFPQNWCIIQILILKPYFLQGQVQVCNLFDFLISPLNIHRVLQSLQIFPPYKMLDGQH